MATKPAGTPASQLRLRTYHVEDGLVVRCHGRLTSEFAPSLKDELKCLLPQSKRIVLDLSDVTHMDSSGLGTLVGLYVSAKGAGCELQVVNLGARLRDLFRITNMFSVFGKCGEYHIKLP